LREIKIKRGLGLQETRCKTYKNKENVFASLWLGSFFVGFKGKIRPRGTKSEAAVVIVNWGTLGTQKESSNIGLIGTLSAGAHYLRGFLTFLCWPGMPGRRRS